MVTVLQLTRLAGSLICLANRAAIAVALRRNRLNCATSMFLLQCGLAVRERVKTPAVIVYKVGDDVARVERGFENFAGEEAPIAGKDEVFFFERVEIGGDLGEGELLFKGREMFGWAKQVPRRDMRRVEGVQFRLREMVKVQRLADALSQPPLDAPGVDPPIHLKAIGGQSHVQPVAHIAIFRTAIGVADCAEFGDVEVGVAAEKRVVRPRDVVKPLMADDLPLGALEREADAAVAVIGMNAQHVRTVFGARTIRRFFDAGEAEDKADEPVIEIRARHDASVMNCGDEDMRGDNVGFTAAPHLALQFFDGGHFFGGFEDFDDGRGHMKKFAAIRVFGG